MQGYAASRLLQALKVPHVHETLVKLGSYIVAEFGHFNVNVAGNEPQTQFDILYRHFKQCAPKSRATLLTSFMKFSSKYPELRSTILNIFEGYLNHWDEDLQQRSSEYYLFCKAVQTGTACGGELDGNSLVKCALEQMPTYSEDLQQNNVLLRRIQKLNIHKGFAISEEEAEKHAADKTKNLEQVQATNIAQSIVNKGAPNLNDLLDTNSAPPQKQAAP